MEKSTNFKFTFFGVSSSGNYFSLWLDLILSLDIYVYYTIFDDTFFVRVPHPFHLRAKNTKKQELRKVPALSEPFLVFQVGVIISLCD